MNLHDFKIIQELGKQYMELAMHPVMEERRRLWTKQKDLKAERPMVLVETGLIENYVMDSELMCEEPANKGWELYLRRQIRHAQEVGDDLVLAPNIGVGWYLEVSGYNIEAKIIRGTDQNGSQLGVAYDHPIHTPDDIDLLKPRTWRLLRRETEESFEQLSELFAGTIPVIRTGINSFIGSMTSDLFKLIGNENLLMWPIDSPDSIHQIMTYLRDDRLALYRWIESEGLLGLNNQNESFLGGTISFTNSLPQPGTTGNVRLQDLWAWIESQETTMISPAMFDEFFLPYIADVANLFGLVYYGCCEQLHDRWKLILNRIPNIRAVSISPWSDIEKMADYLGSNFVYSRKPTPTYISTTVPDWNALRQDVVNTLKAANKCNLEFIFRDVYCIHGDRSHLKTWVEMVRSYCGGTML